MLAVNCFTRKPSNQPCPCHARLRASPVSCPTSLEARSSSPTPAFLILRLVCLCAGTFTASASCTLTLRWGPAEVKTMAMRNAPLPAVYNPGAQVNTWSQAALGNNTRLTHRFIDTSSSLALGCAPQASNVLLTRDLTAKLGDVRKGHESTWAANAAPAGPVGCP